eukprot:5824089-Prymnesium_polylepis.1
MDVGGSAMQGRETDGSERPRASHAYPLSIHADRILPDTQEGTVPHQDRAAHIPRSVSETQARESAE